MKWNFHSSVTSVNKQEVRSKTHLFVVCLLIVAMAEMEARRQGDRYLVTEEEISKYRNDGYVHLKVTNNFFYDQSNVFVCAGSIHL